MQLLYLAGLSVGLKELVTLVPPCILKPRPLWSGKQVITTLLLHVHTDAKHLNCQSNSKTGGDMWSQQQARRGEEDRTTPIDKEEGQAICPPTRHTHHAQKNAACCSNSQHPASRAPHERRAKSSR